jgi:hypothetical protein
MVARWQWQTLSRAKTKEKVQAAKVLASLVDSDVRLQIMPLCWRGGITRQSG